MQKIAFANDNGYISQHFGRCPEFTFVSIEDGKVVTKKNLPNPGHAVGTVPNFIKNQGANAIVCGGMGGRAQQMFADFGIEPIMGVQTSIDEAIQLFIKGELTGGTSMCSPGLGREYGVPRSDSLHHHHEE